MSGLVQILAIACLVPLHRSTLPQGSSQGVQCTAKVRGDPDPQFELLHWIIGYSGLSSYSSSGLLTPEPVPLGVKIKNDLDDVHRFCGLYCTVGPDPLPGDWSISWSVGLDQGGFVDQNGNLQIFVFDGDLAYYLPPQDLEPGTSRHIEVRAIVYDTYSGLHFEDGPLELTFSVDVACSSAGTYSVDIQPGMVTPSGPVATYCFPPYHQCCSLISAGRNTYQDIQGSLSGPNSMTLAEIRPFLMAAYDTDRYVIECGHSVSGCFPVNKYAHANFMDSLNYSWSLEVPPPQFTPVGDGEFLLQNVPAPRSQGSAQVRIGTRTGLFLATQPGYVSVKVHVTGTDGEMREYPDPNRNEPPFIVYISKPAVTQLDMIGTYQVLQDDGPDIPGGAPYPVVAAWLDLNGDQDAVDAGEHRFPVASFLNNGLSIPKAIVAAPDLPRRKLVFRGDGPQNGANQFMYYYGLGDASAGGGMTVYGTTGQSNGPPMLSSNEAGTQAVNFAERVQSYNPYRIS